jgi:hypothetical protein
LTSGQVNGRTFARRRRVNSVEVGATDEMLVDVGSRELVETKPLAARASESRARAKRQLNSAFQAQPARAELRKRLVEVGDPVQEERRVAGEMLGEHQSRALGTDRDLGYARAHRLDSEGHPRPEHVPVERGVALDIPTRDVEDVKRLDRDGVIFPGRAEVLDSSRVHRRW